MENLEASRTWLGMGHEVFKLHTASDMSTSRVPSVVQLFPRDPIERASGPAGELV